MFARFVLPADLYIFARLEKITSFTYSRDHIVFIQFIVKWSFRFGFCDILMNQSLGKNRISLKPHPIIV